MSIALDIGSSRMRSLRRQRYRLIGRSTYSLCTVMPDTLAARRVLDLLGASYATSEGQLIALGDAAETVSELFHVPASPLLPGGRVPRNNPLARQGIATIINALLPEPKREGEFCCFTTTGVLDRVGGRDSEELAFLSQVIRLRGYEPLAIGSAAAVVLAELVGERHSGIGITFGAGSCEAALVHHGMEVARCTVRRGGNWIDGELARSDAQYVWDHAGNRYLDVRRSRSWKETAAGSLLEPTTPREQLCAELFRELVRDVLRAAGETFAAEGHSREVPQPLTVVCQGGTASQSGFRQIVLDLMRTTPLPIGVKQVRIVDEWPYAVARGCLIRAHLEANAEAKQAA